jgi:hypothetical protein
MGQPTLVLGLVPEENKTSSSLCVKCNAAAVSEDGVGDGKEERGEGAKEEEAGDRDEIWEGLVERGEAVGVDEGEDEEGRVIGVVVVDEMSCEVTKEEGKKRTMTMKK